MPHVWSKKDIQCFYAFLWVKHGNRKARNCLCFPQDSIKEEGAELFKEKTPFGENKKNLDDIKKVGKKTSRFEEFGKTLEMFSNI